MDFVSRVVIYSSLLVVTSINLFFSLTFLQTDLHLHCREWDELLNSGEWEPEQITAKLPEFFRFVKEVQQFVLREIRKKTDQ